MPVTTTPERVRRRVGLSAEEASDEALAAFIADEQAFVELAAQRTFAPGDEAYDAVAAIITDLAAVTALESLTGGSGVDYRLGKLDVRRNAQLQHRLGIIEELRRKAGARLEVLLRRYQPRGIVLVMPEEGGA